MSTTVSQARCEARLVVVMGVSGCGKTSVGAAVAERLHCAFVEGDSLHPPANIDKMSAGIPLTDDDRWPWLEVIADRLAENHARGESLVVSCSALKRSYRDRLRQAAGGTLSFVFLEGPRAVLEARMTARTGHFMPALLLDSQFATLEKPTGEPSVVTIDLTQTLDDIVSQAFTALAKLYQ